MADLFIKQAELYAEGRPSYPPELFEFIASKTPSHDLAWDVGAGSGQASRSVQVCLPMVKLAKMSSSLQEGPEVGLL